MHFMVFVMFTINLREGVIIFAKIWGLLSFLNILKEVGVIFLNFFMYIVMMVVTLMTCAINNNDF